MASIAATDAELERIREELPELDLLGSAEMQRQVAAVWVSLMRESSYDRIGDVPTLPGLPAYDLARHTRHVVRNCVALLETLTEFWGFTCDREALVAAALTHDASKVVELEGADGNPTELGRALPHAQLAAVRCLEAGLPPKVAYIVAYHPYTPPHVHVRPRHVEFVLLSWADLAAVDPIFHVEGQPTHLEFEKRFFVVD